MSSVRRALMGALLAAAIPALTSTSALAAGAPPVHPTPSVPVIVDGTAYTPQQIHRFDGRPLYMRTSKDGSVLVAYTKLARFKAFLSTQGVTLPSTARKPRAHASGAGQWTKFCTDRFEQGWCYTINSGWGLANVRALDGCSIFTCWNYENNVEWVRANGPGAVLFDLPNFAGAAFYLFPSETVDLTNYGWGNRMESVYQPW